MSTNWTVQDVLNGDCEMDQVGSAKPETPPEEPENIDKAAILDSLLENSVTHQTQEEFNKWAKVNPNAYNQALAKYNLDRRMKEKPTVLPKLETLTARDLETYSSADIKKMLLNSKGITTKDQAQDALDRAQGAGQ